MSYPVDLDEISTSQLRAELARREDLRAKGLCPYCARGMDETPCKMASMHKGEDL